MKDPSLAESFEKYRGKRAGSTFEHRQGLSAALNYAASTYLGNTQNHAKENLPNRIKKWLVILLTRELPQAERFTARHVRTLAQRIVSRLEYDEEEHGKKIPLWENPPSAADVLGSTWVNETWVDRLKNAALSPLAQAAIWRVWGTLAEHMGQGKLPLCNTHFDKDGWKAYLPLLCQILKDTEAADKHQVAVPDEPVDQPSRAWGNRKVKKILGVSMLDKAGKRAARELLGSISRKLPFHRHLKGFFKVLIPLDVAVTETFISKVLNASTKTSWTPWKRRGRSTRSKTTSSGPRSITRLRSHTGCSAFSRSTALAPVISPWTPVSSSVSTGSCGKRAIVMGVPSPGRS
jgi:hypothetical protein